MSGDDAMTSQELLVRLRQDLRYDPETGKFTWLMNTHNARTDAEAGHLLKSRYVSIKYRRKSYYAHRLAWLYVHGRWPSECVDHVNGIRDDNRICNLRECTNAENQQNLTSRGKGRSGLTGVIWNKSSGKWEVRIRAAGPQQYFGLFDDKHEAHQVYLKAKARLHKFQPTPRAETSELSI